MNWTIRPFEYTEAEYRDVLEVRNAAFPDNPSTVEIWQHWDNARDPDSKFERLVVNDKAGQLIAYAQFDEIKPENRTFAFNFQLKPSYWQSGLGETLFQAVLDRIANHEAARLTIHVRESEVEKLKILKQHGFKLVMRSPVSYLEVDEFEPGKFKDIVEKVRSSGVRISQPPSGWHQDPNWQRLVHELHWALMQDVPHYEERTKPTLAQFVREELKHPNFMPQGYFIAFIGERAVGMTHFAKRGGGTQRLATGVTGVLRNYRRRGIATALKVRSIIFAQNIEAKVIMTDNEENNPMYVLNEKLGFKPQPAWTDWEKA